ncbi:MAG: glycosyltransferase family 2 protein [Lachnospiraceae bacterium]|nr:glycosyltransferase family 2 protein [Lachnospiraceae bacterium]
METKVTVIIPNHNGEAYIRDCLDAMRIQTMKAKIIVVDDASTDGSLAYLIEQEEKGLIELVQLPENKGFAAAVNAGIKRAQTRYVILLNNDTSADKDFVQDLYLAMRKKKKTFSVSGLMLQMDDPGIIDDCGDVFSALGWAFSPGRDKPRTDYITRARISSACGGAAIYDRRILLELGLFDEQHFAYLEDVDIGLRAQRKGYYNFYEPDAVVYHKASAASGSRYNAFKTRLTTANTIYVIYKNWPVWIIVLNMPLLVAGFFTKMVFYARKGFFKDYLAGVKEGAAKVRHSTFPRPVTTKENIRRHLLFEAELLANCIRRVTG